MEIWVKGHNANLGKINGPGELVCKTKVIVNNIAVCAEILPESDFQCSDCITTQTIIVDGGGYAQ